MDLPTPPRPPRDVPPGGDVCDDPPLDANYLRNSYFREMELPPVGAAERADWAELRLDRVNLAEPDLAVSSLTDVVLTGCDLANVAAHGSSWRRVTFTDCRLTGLGLGEATLRDVTFTGCRMDIANLRFARLDRVAFVECELDDSELLAATLRDVSFEGCRFGEAELSQLTCERVTLRNCTLDRAKGLTALRGAAMPWTDLVGLAGAMASALGIRTLDAD